MDQRKQEELTKFFEAIFTGTEGYIDIRTFVHIKDGDKIKTIQKDHFFRKVKDIKDLVRALSNENFVRGKNIHFGVAPRTKTEENEKQTGAEKDIKMINCLWCDADCKREKQPELPTKEEKIKEIEKFELPPSIIVDSGLGYQCYWLLKVPIPIKNREMLLEVKGILKGLTLKMGGDLAGHDLCRLLRVPGTKNIKPECPLGLEARVIKFEPNLKYGLEFKKFMVKIEDLPGIDIDIKDVPIPHRFEELLKENKKLQNTYLTRDRPDISDQTGSGYDMALTNILIKNGFSDSEIGAIIRSSKTGKGLKATKQYLIKTIGKGRAFKVTSKQNFNPRPYKEIIESIESKIDNFQRGVYKDSEELLESVKKELIENLINLPSLGRTIYKLKLIEIEMFTYLDLEADLNTAIREGRQKTLSKNHIAIPKPAPYEIDQKRLDRLLEKAIPDKGFLRDYVDICSEITDTPKTFLFWGAMTTLATVLGKEVFVNWETRRLYPNIWCVFLAPSGFRKGTAIDTPVKILWEIDKDLLLPSVGSEEGLTKALSIGQAGGREVGFIRWQEFAKILKSWNTRGSWIASQEFFIDLWDSKPFKKKLSKEEFIVGETAVSFLGGCIPASFSKYFSLEDLELGFFGRIYLITCIEKEKYLTWPGILDESDVKRLAKELEDIRNKYYNQEMGRKLIGKDFNDWALKIHKNREPGYLNAFFSRIETHCIKLSMLYEAALGGNTSISEEAFYYATRALNFITESAKPMVSETIGLNEEQMLTREIERYIKKRGKVYKADIIEKFNLRWRIGTDIEKTLVEKESIYIMSLKPLPGSEGGRPRSVYVAIN